MYNLSLIVVSELSQPSWKVIASIYEHYKCIYFGYSNITVSGLE